MTLAVRELDLNYAPPAIQLRGEEEIAKPVENLEKYPWFRHHPLALLNNVQIPLGIRKGLVPAFESMTRDIYDGLAREYIGNNCMVMVCDDGKVHRFSTDSGLKKLRDEMEKDVLSPHDAGSNIVTINPVYLGGLPDEAMRAISDEQMPLNEFKKILKKYLPESDNWIYAKNIGGRKLKLDPLIHPHFTNLIFIEDNKGAISKLPAEKMLIVMRMLMAKIGASNSIVVPFKQTESEIIMDHMISTTMEGGYPFPTSFADLAHELMAFGSSKEVGGYSVIDNAQISKKVWKENPIVKAMIDWGKYLGRNNLISPPISIRKLTRSRILRYKIERSLGWKRQAESAFWALVPKMKVRFTRDGEEIEEEVMVKIVSNSGTSGAIKDKLRYGNISAVLSVTDGKVDIIPVEGTKPDKTSVEAEEFLGPLDQLDKVKVSENEDGLFFDENGTEVPVIRAGFHLHRGLKSIKIDGKQVEIPKDINYIQSGSGKVAYMVMDNKTYPHVGCGVDTMQNMSKEAMKEATRIWKESGGKVQLVLVYVPNHGINGFTFFSPEENGYIPVDPYEQTIKLMEEKEFELKFEVPQVTFSEGKFPTYRYSIISPN